MEPRVIIGVPTYGNIYPHFIWSLFGIIANSLGNDRVLHHLNMITGSYVHDARNTLVQQVLADPACTHLFFIDQDMTGHPDVIRRLLAHRLPIVSAWYCDRSDPPRTTAWYWETEFHRIDRHQKSGLQQVGGVPMGMTLIETDLLRTMSECYGDEQWFQVTPEKGEDVFFCHRLKEMGIPVYLDNDVRVGHLALVPLTYEHWLAGQEIPAAA